MDRAAELEQPLLEQAQPDRSFLGMNLMIGGFLLQNFHMVFIKQLFKQNSEITFVEVFFTRALFQCFFALIALHRFNISLGGLSWEHHQKLVVRFVFGFLTWICFYYSISALSVGLMQTIANTVPLISLVVAYFLLGEVLKCVEIANISVSFLATIVIILYSQGIGSPSEVSLYIVGCSVCGLGSLFQAFSYVLISSLKDISPFIIITYQSTLNTLAAGLLMVFLRSVLAMGNGYSFNFSSSDYQLLTGLGFTGVFGQILQVYALKYEKSGRAVSLMFLQVVFGYLSDIVLFG